MTVADFQFCSVFLVPIRAPSTRSHPFFSDAQIPQCRSPSSRINIESQLNNKMLSSPPTPSSLSPCPTKSGGDLSASAVIPSGPLSTQHLVPAVGMTPSELHCTTNTVRSPSSSPTSCSGQVASSPPASPICAGCGQSILDRYVMSVGERQWHERCLTCAVCRHLLTRSCYVKERHLYCKHDYDKLYSIKCSGCFNSISPTEFVMRVHGAIYHTACFSCVRCGRQLTKGDEFAVRQGRLVCRVDLEKEAQLVQFGDHHNSPERNGGDVPPGIPMSPINDSAMAFIDQNTPGSELQMDVYSLQSDQMPPNDSAELMPSTNMKGVKKHTGPVKQDGRRGPKRPRTILTTSQRRAFKSSFEISSKPCRKVRETLAKETGLNVRIVQVWFQNQRAKLKKIQRKQQQSQLANGAGSLVSGGGFLAGNGSESGGIGSHSSDKSKDESTDEEDDDNSVDTFGMQTMQYMIQSPEGSYYSTGREEESASTYLLPESDLGAIDDSETSLCELDDGSGYGVISTNPMDQTSLPSHNQGPRTFPSFQPSNYQMPPSSLDQGTSSPRTHPNDSLTHLDKLYKTCTNFLLL